MEVVKNSSGKTICRVDGKDKVVEIKNKEIVTTIHFLNDGNIEITNKIA